MADEQYIQVQAAPAAGNRGVFWERDAAHPGGEVSIGPDDPPTRVAPTTAVRAAIRQGRLVEVGQDAAVASAETSNGPADESESDGDATTGRRRRQGG
jgi:hypothetical protein